MCISVFPNTSIVYGFNVNYMLKINILTYNFGNK